MVLGRIGRRIPQLGKSSSKLIRNNQSGLRKSLKHLDAALDPPMFRLTRLDLDRSYESPLKPSDTSAGNVSQTGYPTSMSPDQPWMSMVAKLGGFLKSIGLHLEHQEESAAFGNKLFLYRGESLKLRVLSDRSVWLVEVANVQAADSQWFDVAIIRELLFGAKGEDILSLEQQIDFIEGNWSAISICFGPSQWLQTSARLSFLCEERIKRRLPGLFTPPSRVN